MNHVQTKRIAWENAVKAAKASGRGLQIWPGDEQRVRLEDLPVLPDGWAANLKGRAWDVFAIAVNNDKQLQSQVKVGRFYALGTAVPDSEGYYMVIEQG